ncbi:hypothetical protein [Vibrio sp. SCSIO 43155]|uniref:hypothetical protein n=1 Tax=Vibrio sp. SCSIO 43155 TaxID=2819099 RepID=UPI002074D271|nr:hypothetical protein [Vibrio sp. SCSIO 43155]USD53612.1 hypothetical protein J4N44_09825 [Vibrio sp. SCSIO 43155]
MTEFILEHIVVVLGTGSVAITGLSSWLGKVWSTRIAIREKAEYQEKLDNLKRAHEKELSELQKKHETALEILRSQLLTDSELLKVRLKKSEFLFELELEAASAFVSMNRKLQPEKGGYIDPTQEFVDDYCKLDERTTELKKAINAFLNQYGAVLDSMVKQDLEYCLTQCNDLTDAALMGAQFAGSDIRMVYSRLSEIEQRLIVSFKEQTAT